MPQNVKYQLWIALAAAVVFFTNLGVTALWDLDEPLYASCAREMWQRGDWVVPRYNGDYFFDKPPLMFWTMIAGFEMFGVNEFAARFWSAVLGVGTALLTYHLGRLLFNAKVGFWAGLAMSSHILFTISARAATVDAALTLVTTLAVLLFVVATRATKRDGSTTAVPTAVGWGGSEVQCWGGSWTAAPTSSPRGQGAFSHQAVPQGDVDSARTPPVPCVSSPLAFIPRSWLLFALIYVCMGVAVLGKGPVGFLLPLATLGLFLLIMNQPAAPDRPQPTSRFGRIAAWIRAMLRPFAPRNFLRVTWAMRPLTAAAGCGRRGTALVRSGWPADRRRVAQGILPQIQCRSLSLALIGTQRPVLLPFRGRADLLLPLGRVLDADHPADRPPHPRASSVVAGLRVDGLLAGRVLRVLVGLQHEVAALRPARVSGLGLADRLLPARLVSRSGAGQPPLDSARQRHAGVRRRGDSCCRADRHVLLRARRMADRIGGA